MFWYFSLFLQRSWFFKRNNCLFYNKTTQEFAEYWEICGNFKTKTKTKEFWKKKIVIFMIFTSPYYLSRVKGYSQLLLCEAPNGIILVFVLELSSARNSSLVIPARPSWKTVRRQVSFSFLSLRHLSAAAVSTAAASSTAARTAASSSFAVPFSGKNKLIWSKIRVDKSGSEAVG